MEPSQNLETILDAAPAVDIVTFDFFDTLVTRAVAQPTHVFALMEERLCTNETRWTGFARDRVEAEHAARREAHRDNPHRDVTIDEIYRQLSATRNLTASDVAVLIAREHETEIELARAVRHGMAWWQTASRRGLRRVIVSDNYMSSAHIVAMARAAGYDDIDPSMVWVSCEHGGQKHNSVLWRVVVDALGGDASRIVHLGDDAHADGTVPTSLGIRSHVNPSMRVSHRDMHNTTPAVLPLSRLEAHLRDAHAHQWDTAAALGAGAVALVVASQVKEALHHAREIGARHVHFAARDGYLAHGVWHRIRATDPSMPDASYLSFSRSVVWRATLTQVTHDNAHRFVGDDEVLTLSRLERRLGCSFNESLHRSLSDSVLDATRARALLVDNADVVIAASRRLRDRMTAHLRACGVLEPGDHVVVDLGWTASTVADLAELVSELTNGAARVHGLFTGLYWDATAQRTRMPMHGVAMDEIAPLDDNLRLLGVVKFMEALVTAPHGSVVDFTEVGDPIAAETPAEQRAYAEVMGTLGAAAAESAEQILRGSHRSGVSADDVTPAAVWAAMMQAGHTPRLDEIALLVGVHHVTDIDHVGEGRPMIAAVPHKVRMSDHRALEDLHDALIRRHWMQASLTSWRQHGAGDLVTAIERAWPHTHPVWVHTLSVR